MIKPASLLILVTLIASCASDHKSADQMRKESCATVCNQYDALPCSSPPASNLNPLAFLDEYAVGSCEYVCEEGDATTVTKCQSAHDVFVHCAAESGLICGEKAYDSVRVIGCDEAAAALAEACGSCVSLPSAAENGCPSNRPFRFVCSQTSTAGMSYDVPFCHSACEKTGVGQYCCEEGYTASDCTNQSDPVCSGC